MHQPTRRNISRKISQNGYGQALYPKQNKTLPGSNGINFAFLGTPDFAAIVLRKLIDAEMPPKIVVCNPDRPVGRKHIITPPPAKVLAEEHGIKVWQPEKLTLPEWQKEVGEIDFAVVAAYAKIIKKEILDTAKLGVIGVHPSLLPQYRGATPIQSSLLNGEKETGTTLYFVDEFVDHGPVIASEKCRVAADETYTTLLQKLAALGGKLLAEVIPELAAGYIKAQAQDETLATLTKKFKTEDGLVNLEKDAPLTVFRKIRALNPEPGVFTFRNGKRVKLLEASWEDGKLKIIKTQVEGEKPRSATQYL